MKTISYKTTGTCARTINISVDENIIHNVSFEGGCGGNTQGVASLLIGMRVDDAIARLKGIKCGSKATSCPDQLALALETLSQD